MSGNFGLGEDQINKINPLSPNKPRGAARFDDRKVLSGVICSCCASITGRRRVMKTVYLMQNNALAGWPKRCLSYR